MGNVAYLFPAFPVFHQTFVLWEVLGLRRNGVRPKIYSMRRPTPQQQPEARDVANEVTYLPGMVSLSVLRANWQFLRANPRRYARLYRDVIRAWRTGGRVPTSLRGSRGRVTLYDRVRGWFNSQPFLYLLKSLLLVPSGVYLAQQLAGDEISHLHAHWASYPATVAYVVHRVSGLPFSISAHAYDIYMVPRMLPAKLRAARFVVTCAQANAAYLRQLAGAEVGDKILVSYHGVDTRRFAPPEARGEGERCLNIVSCGQLEHYKGMHHLIDACAALRDSGTPLQCWIVGEGPQRDRLERQADQLGLNGMVRLVGARPQTEVAELFRKADLFVLASEMAGKSGRRDVIANVVVEAMAAGLPVVVSRVPGMEELVEDGVTGYLVPPNRSDKLAHAMAVLAARPDERKRFGDAGRLRVLRDFDSSKNVQRLARLFSELSDDTCRSLAATAV
jgi:glycosyltransferase involved in cell wall biosynthesis